MMYIISWEAESSGLTRRISAPIPIKLGDKSSVSSQLKSWHPHTESQNALLNVHTVAQLLAILTYEYVQPLSALETAPWVCCCEENVFMVILPRQTKASC